MTTRLPQGKRAKNKRSCWQENDLQTSWENQRENGLKTAIRRENQVINKWEY